MIDKRIAKSKKLACLKHDRSRVLYFMILPHLDVEGKFTGDPEEIKEDCCPKLKYSVIKIAESIIELSDVGLLNLYEVNGLAFIQYTKFDDFQVGIRKDKEAPSRIPNQVRTKDEPTPSLYRSLRLMLRKEGNKKKEIYFDFDKRKFFNITIEDKAGWKDAYPICDIDQELSIMREWLLSHPEKAKIRYRRFITGWLTRNQDKGGTKLNYEEQRKKKLDEWVSKPLEK